MKRLALVLMAIAGAAVGGCAYAPGIANQAVAFNEGVADSTNRILLLNALRARDRLPTYYTRATGDTANASAGPSLGFSVPLGPNAAARGYGSSVSVGGSTQHLVGLQNLDDKRFMNGVLQPLKLEVLEFYLGQSWPGEVLFTLTVGRISLKRDDAETLIAAFESDCRDDPRGDYCNATLPAGLAATGGGEHLASLARGCLPPTAGRVTFRNYPPDPVQTGCFKAMLRIILALGPAPHKLRSYELVADGLVRDRNDASTIAEVAKSDLVFGPGSDPTTYVLCRKSSTEALALRKFETARASAHVTLDGDTPLKSCGGRSAREIEPGRGTVEIQFATRSLDGMIYYLGELMRAGSASSTGEIWVWSGAQGRYAVTRLFVVENGKRSGAPVSVRFNRDRYSIPPADASHRSLQVVSLLNQVWGLQKEQNDAPSAAAVIVGG